MKTSLTILVIPVLSMLISCNNLEKSLLSRSLKPTDLQAQKVVRLNRGELDVVFADNSSYGAQHLAKYNGIAELYHSAQDSSIFVPAYAGFNLEHIFGGDSLTELFEPRVHPMELYQLSDTEVLLYQSATPFSAVESLTKFQLVEPHYIDVTLRLIILDDTFFKHNYAGFFWASYIHGPSDRKIYFQGSKVDMDSIGWVSAYSNEHGSESTHLSKQHKTPVYFATNFNATLASHFSNYEYLEPFYYGRFHNMVLAFMFNPANGIRFSQSPTGGGDKNPAWDFQLIIPVFEVGKEYSFQARLMYMEFEGAEEVHEEYYKWKSSIGYE